MRSPTETEMISPGTRSSALTRETWPPFRMTFASLAEYSCRAAMAFSALLSCETPTTALRMRMVRIWQLAWLGALTMRERTHDSGVNKGAPAALVFEESEDKGDGGRTEQDQDQLVLELLKNELPQRGGRVLGDRCDGQYRWRRRDEDGERRAYSCGHAWSGARQLACQSDHRGH